MKKIFFTLLFVCCIFASFSQNTGAFEFVESSHAVSTNINIGGSAGNESSNSRRLDKLQDFNEQDQFIDVSTGGERGLFNTMILFARDLKNLFYAVATVFFLIIVLRLIFASNTEEEVGRFKKGIIWITVGLIVMQLAYAFALIAFDQGVSASLAARIMDNLIMPLIELLRTLASFFFIAIAIYAFYKLVTANGNEEAVKNGRLTIFYAIIGFLIIRFAQAIVEAFYGRINCQSYSIGFVTYDGANCINVSDISQGASIIVTVINWLNGFVAIAVLIMIIYAGVQILLSQGDEERIKKGKQSIIYIAIGLLILVVNFLLLTFFLRPEAVI